MSTRIADVFERGRSGFMVRRLINQPFTVVDMTFYIFFGEEVDKKWGSMPQEDKEAIVMTNAFQPFDRPDLHDIGIECRNGMYNERGLWDDYAIGDFNKWKEDMDFKGFEVTIFPKHKKK